MRRWVAVYEGWTDSFEVDRPRARLTPIIAPVSAPQVPQVRAIPLQKAVATLGKSSDSTPFAFAIARTTLSAQKRPPEKNSSADLRTSSMADGSMSDSGRKWKWLTSCCAAGRRGAEKGYS